MLEYFVTEQMAITRSCLANVEARLVGVENLPHQVTIEEPFMSPLKTGWVRDLFIALRIHRFINHDTHVSHDVLIGGSLHLWRIRQAKDTCEQIVGDGGW